MSDRTVKITPRRNYLQLTEEEIFALARRLMTEEKRFLDPGLTMESFADEMNVRRYLLSQSINRFAGVSFPDWLAEYRIAEVVRLASLAENSGVSWKQLSGRAGFSSRTTFYRAFRKLRGASPGEMLKQDDKRKIK